MSMPGVTKDNVIKATKWSAMTEILSKLVAPISTIILARLLTPDAFGILVTATMVISFAEIFSDAGFQKYLIQHEFASDQEMVDSANVAFLCNFAISINIWLVIFVFSDSLAEIVGCPGYGRVLVISALCIPIAAFSSIQMALYRRKLDFKTLFYVKLVGICVPIFVTVPLAYFTRSYWSLIIGMLALNATNAIVLTLKSKWKPAIFFDFKLFKSMFSFSAWTLLETLLVWFTSYIDIFLVGSLLSQYYLGVYRTSMNTVAQITSVVVSATTPVLYSALSRLQNNRAEFEDLFFKFQKYVGVLLIPLGAGIFLFRDFVVDMLLGKQWADATYFIGLWGATTPFVVIFSHYNSEVYRAIGKPKYSIVVQILHLLLLIPILLLFVRADFDDLCLARSVARLQLVLVNMCVIFFVVKVSPLRMMLNIVPSLVATLSMSGFVVIMQKNTGVNVWMSIVLACVFYFSVILCFPKERSFLISLKRRFVK